MDKKKVFIYLPMNLPIPAVGGGAIETLITNLIEENELQQLVELIIISKNDEKAKRKKYHHTKIYYFEDEVYNGKVQIIYKAEWFLYRIWFKLFQNRISKKHIKTDYSYMSFFVYQCYRIAKKEKVDVVVSEGRLDESEWGIWNRLVGQKNVYNHIHGNRPENIASRLTICNSILVSEYIKKTWIKNDNIEGKTYVLKNGIDLALFNQPFSIEAKTQTKRKLKLHDDDFVGIYCGRIAPEKGIEQLLDAFSLIDNAKIKLILIGSPAFSENIITNFSEKMIKRTERSNNVIYLGYVPNDKIQEYFAVSNIYIMPPVYQDAAPLAVIEAMASGLPLIMTKSGGTVEYATEACAIMLDIDDNLSVNLAKSILELSKDKSKRERMSKAGKERASCFSRQNYYKDFLRIINSD